MGEFNGLNVNLRANFFGCPRPPRKWATTPGRKKNSGQRPWNVVKFLVENGSVPETWQTLGHILSARGGRSEVDWVQVCRNARPAADCSLQSVHCV
jgi:hypothetical protein